MGRETLNLAAHVPAVGCMIPFPMFSKVHACRAALDSAIRGDLAVGRCPGWRREAAHDGGRCVGVGGITVEREVAVCGGVAQHRLNLEEQVHAGGRPEM